MKKRFLWITLFLIIGLIIIYFITIPKVEMWDYDLPNDYVVKKESETEVIIGKYKNNQINKNKIINEYIAEFSYSDNYISLKCLDVTNKNVKINFYIINSKNDEIYGPYYDYETYSNAKDEIINEKLSNWIETITNPNN